MVDPAPPVARPGPVRNALRALGALILVGVVLGGFGAGGVAAHGVGTSGAASAPTSGAVGNFTASINRLVDLVGLAGGGILALVWARVALSWFSNDVTKKVQAKDRARDALVGTLLFAAAVTGLFWGLAHWVLTGS